MKKAIDVYLKEYCHRLSDEDFDYLHQRATQKLFGDTAEILNFLSKTKELDKWLSAASSCQEFSNMLDLFDSVIEKEAESRRTATVVA
jgi:hypothetical protein